MFWYLTEWCVFLTHYAAAPHGPQGSLWWCHRLTNDCQSLIWFQSGFLIMLHWITFSKLHIREKHPSLVIARKTVSMPPILVERFLKIQSQMNNHYNTKWHICSLEHFFFHLYFDALFSQISLKTLKLTCYFYFICFYANILATIYTKASSVNAR